MLHTNRTTLKRLLHGSAAIIALAVPAVANGADLPLKAPPAPIVAPAASWTGFYVGLGVGFRSSQTDATVTSVTQGGIDALAFSCGIDAALGGCFNSEPLNDTAFRFSPYGGFNWQVAPQWVVGIEGDWGWADKTTTLNGLQYPSSLFVNGGAPDRFSVKTTWDASARGRIGFLATPSVLLYTTGGPAWLHVDSSSACNTGPAAPCEPANPSAFSNPPIIAHSTTKLGWTIGGGIEAMLWQNWVARGEYRYADFGTISNTDSRLDGAGVAKVVSYDLRVRTHTATFGLAYKFGGGSPIAPADMPVTAPVYKAPPAVIASWTGPYAGLSVGIRSTQTEATVTGSQGGFDTSLAAICALLAGPRGGCFTGEPLNDTAFRFSPYGGFNWQAAPQWVVGIEGDWGWANKTTTLNGIFYPFSGGNSGGFANETFSVKTTWDASARGRIGFLATPSVLLYATGGPAWLHVESTSSCSTNALLPGFCAAGLFSPAVVGHSTTKLGWTVGGGVEAMLWQNWVARGEYRYGDFGTISNTDIRTGGALLAPGRTQTVSYDLRVRTHTAMFGVAYKFDWGGPVIAKY